jgi:hypothetical protein
VLNPEHIVYSLDVGDIQSIAEEEISRQLTDDELNHVIDNLPGYIDWQHAILLAIQESTKLGQ